MMQTGDAAGVWQEKGCLHAAASAQALPKAGPDTAWLPHHVWEHVASPEAAGSRCSKDLSGMRAASSCLRRAYMASRLHLTAGMREIGLWEAWLRSPHLHRLTTTLAMHRLRELRIDDGNGASTISCSVLGGFLEGYAAQLPALTSLHVCGLHPKDRLHGLRQLLQCLGTHLPKLQLLALPLPEAYHSSGGGGCAQGEAHSLQPLLQLPHMHSLSLGCPPPPARGTTFQPCVSAQGGGTKAWASAPPPCPSARLGPEGLQLLAQLGARLQHLAIEGVQLELCNNGLRALGCLEGLQSLRLGHYTVLPRDAPPHDFSPLSRLTLLTRLELALCCRAGSLAHSWATPHALLRALPTASLAHLALDFPPLPRPSAPGPAHLLMPGPGAPAAANLPGAGGQAAGAAAQGAAALEHHLPDPDPDNNQAMPAPIQIPPPHPLQPTSTWHLDLLQGSGVVLPALRSLHAPCMLGPSGVAILAELCPNLASLTVHTALAGEAQGAMAWQAAPKMRGVTCLQLLAWGPGSAGALELQAAFPGLRSLLCPQLC